MRLSFHKDRTEIREHLLDLAAFRTYTGVHADIHEPMSYFPDFDKLPRRTVKAVHASKYVVWYRTWPIMWWNLAGEWETGYVNDNPLLIRNQDRIRDILSPFGYYDVTHGLSIRTYRES